jgi:Predicted membrane protein (DUF2207)
VFGVNHPLGLTPGPPEATLCAVPSVRIRFDQPRKAALGCVLVLALLLLVVVGVVVAGRTLGDALDAMLDRLQPGALIAAGVTTAALVVALGVVRWSRRPRRPEGRSVPAEIGRDLPALRAEPPAVAGFLTDGFEPHREGVPATLLDLAARGVVALEGIGEELRIRIPEPDEDGELLPHERRVLELVNRRAHDGSVPGAALTSGPREHARGWWRGFRNEVIDEAQARGLSRDVWDRATLFSLGAASLVPATLLLVETRNWGAGVMYVLAAFVLLGWIRERRAQRDTDAGLAAAADWLGVRAYLREAELEDLPPASVTIWERYLAYAAAFGVAQAAVEAIPMGAEEDRRAWSSHGGRWREVRIRYPFAWPPAWGWLPAVALVVSIAGIAVSAGLLRLAAGIGWPQQGLGDPPGLVAFVRGLAVAAWAAGAIIGLWSTVAVVRSVADLGRRRQVSGYVLRLRTFGGSSDDPGRHYLALDDGSANVIRAWRVPDELWASVPAQYRTATITVWPHLGRVRSLG